MYDNQMIRVAFITGANRGIGLELSRQLAKLHFTVLMGCRSVESGKAVAEVLHSEGLTVEMVELDVTKQDHIDRTFDYVVSKFGRLDVLINNAAVFLDPPKNPDGSLGDRSVLRAKPEIIYRSMETNTIAPLKLCQRFVPLMLKNNYGRIINISSGVAQLSEMNGGMPAYRMSKVSLNALTRILADELKNTNVLINSVDPGWVKTRMGGQNAELTPEESASKIIWLATLPDGGPSGGFFYETEKLLW
jgi:NAD(P)-dependent dehydrogenase (short-subunit alcohol dehydrogenase family)